MIDTYGNVDLGTLDWNKEGLNFYTISISNNIKKPKDDNTIANIYCNLYRAVPLSASFVEGDMAVGTHGYLYIRNTKYTTTAEFKEAMKGQILRYELETPANGGYLPMYKGRYKVSDVCQLLDKSKLPNTQTVNGITYTVDKVNGTITANGTATAESNYKTDIALNNAESYTNGGGTKIPSRILFLGCPIGGSQTTYGFYNNWVSSGVVDTGNGGITDTTSNKYFEYYRFNLRITISQGYTANNLVFKPQLFDLTEMYGAGNEPTTVEEFKQKFPNELYPYSPYCWVNMKQMRYITTTKNLFDNIVPANNCRVSFATSRAIATQIAADTDTLGLFKIVSYNGSSYEVLSWIRDVLTLGRITGTFTTPETTGYKHILFGLNGAKIDTTCLCEINLKPSTTYTFSCNFTNITQGSISWTDMQLEEGATATPYVPYGYLPLK